MNYGISTVIGGFGRELSQEELIPYSVARTYWEHRSLRELLRLFYQSQGDFREALEVGCGYGRHLSLLNEYALNVTGLERDEQLRKIAKDLNPKAAVVPFTFTNPFTYRSGVFDLILTFTFLQHLSDDEVFKTIEQITRVACPGAILIICEETDQKKSAPECKGRSVESYENLFSMFKPLMTIERIVEPTFPEKNSGTYMVFKKEAI